MADVTEVWQQALPQIRQQVTGVGVWTALNGCKPLTIEDGFLVLGLPSQETELAGHLKMPQIKRLIEKEVNSRLDAPVTLRVIEGTTDADWERVKRRDAEARRLHEASQQRLRAEIESRTNWEVIYEQLSRRYAALQNKSMPQNRARFYDEGVAIVAEARKNQANPDELSERNFARCLERLAQYSEVPSTIVAQDVLKQAGEL
jgi:hypothetical protein